MVNIFISAFPIHTARCWRSYDAWLVRTTLELVIGCSRNWRLAASLALWLRRVAYSPLNNYLRGFLRRVAAFPVRHCVDRYLYRHQYDRRALASMVRLPIFLDSSALISAVLLVR